ncbi:MAG: ABC-type transport auxiliary lipoprotein family protein [Burkholderiales bacterium]
MRTMPFLLAAVLAAGLAACSWTRPPVERVSFDLAPARTGPAAGTPDAAVLKVRPFRVAAPYDNREFLYRMADGQLVADFYHGFAAGPGELVTAATVNWLKASGRFRSVLEPGISADAPYVLEGAVHALYGDLRDAQRPAAVLEVQVYLVRAAGDREVVLDRRYAERIALADGAPAAIAQGYDQALAAVLARLERDLGALALKP